VKHHGLDVDVDYQVYVPQAQWAWAETALTLLLRTDGEPAALVGPMRDIVRTLDAAQPVTNVRVYEDVVAASIGTRRFAATLLSVFAVTTVVMAMVGLYGSLGVMVSQRRRELGVRLALGATFGRIRGLVLTQGLRPVGVGLAAGVTLAAVLVGMLDSMLFGISALDAPTFLAAGFALVLCAFAACLVPAVRAARIDPATTLRE